MQCLAKLMQQIEENVRVAYTQIQAKAEQIKIAENGVADATESTICNDKPRMTLYKGFINFSIKCYTKTDNAFNDKHL